MAVHDPALRATAVPDSGAETEVLPGICLVTGERDSIAMLHPKIASVSDKPTPLAAVNDQSLPALASFGKVMPATTVR